MFSRFAVEYYNQTIQSNKNQLLQIYHFKSMGGKNEMTAQFFYEKYKRILGKTIVI